MHSTGDRAHRSWMARGALGNALAWPTKAAHGQALSAPKDATESAAPNNGADDSTLVDEAPLPDLRNLDDARARFERATATRQGVSPATNEARLTERGDLYYDDTWLPKHRPDGTLPPHVGERMFLRLPCSPYEISMRDMKRLFVTSERRERLFEGLVSMRRDLARIGVTDGFQWVAGSFVEKGAREPKDIDVVTFFLMPESWNDRASRERVMSDNENLFVRKRSLETYGADSYLVRLAMRSAMFRELVLWYALYGHDRHTLAWKGFVELDLRDMGT